MGAMPEIVAKPEIIHLVEALVAHSPLGKLKKLLRALSHTDESLYAVGVSQGWLTTAGASHMREVFTYWGSRFPFNAEKLTRTAMIHTFHQVIDTGKNLDAFWLCPAGYKDFEAFVSFGGESVVLEFVTPELPWSEFATDGTEDILVIDSKGVHPVPRVADIQ